VWRKTFNGRATLALHGALVHNKSAPLIAMMVVMALFLGVRQGSFLQ
jgi:hypothetical protein